MNAPPRRLGMQPKVQDENAFRFRTFVNVDRAKVPASHDRKLGRDWQMLGNDRYGDCADVARAHGIMIMSHVEKKPFTVTTDDVVKDYLAYSPNDDGTDPDAMMSMWRQSGPWGTQPIKAYLSLSLGTAVLDIPRADYLFGSCYMGIALPRAVQDAWGSWPKPPSKWQTDPAWAPYSWGGHMVMTHGYHTKGVKIVTWGKDEWLVPWEFVRAYLMCAYAVIHPIWFNKKSKTPQGLDEAALNRELSSL